VNPSQRNYHLKYDSKAINAGVDPESFFPHNIFPDFHWNIDMDDTTRPIGSGWDIGAYEYSGSTGIYEKENVSKYFMLYQNYPNPFNPSTKIQFVVPSDGHVRIRVYNCLGQIVATPFEGESKAGQYQTVQIDGSRLSSGVYFYCVEHRGQSIMKRMVLIK
jgi:hypothetical protein